ncbi:MAG: hypothetical protein LUD15_10890 [Bacteroides sp.]|nr:hypothetical protein [Bacteroides sp.]
MKIHIHFFMVCILLLTSCEWTSNDPNTNLSELGPGSGIVEYTGYEP